MVAAGIGQNWGRRRFGKRDGVALKLRGKNSERVVEHAMMRTEFGFSHRTSSKGERRWRPLWGRQWWRGHSQQHGALEEEGEGEEVEERKRKPGRFQMA